MSVWPAIWAEISGLDVSIVVGLGALILLGVTDSLMLPPLGLVPLAAVGLTMAVATVMIGIFGAVALAGNQVAMSVGGLL